MNKVRITGVFLLGIGIVLIRFESIPFPDFLSGIILGLGIALTGKAPFIKNKT